MNQKKLEQLRHSAAHLLAHAIQELFPNTLFTLGPATKDGFFYDFLPEKNIREEDLVHIEKRMYEIAQKNFPITHTQISKQEARILYKNNPFKLELIDNIPGDTVGIAQQGNFVDLCRGGHVQSTGDIKYFKLLGISGSYWRADKSKQVLQRITGTAFFTQQELDTFEQQRKDALLYDHRRLGQELNLFSFHEEGPGFPFFHPNGQKIINILKNFLRKKLDQAQYQEIATPLLLSEKLWHQSGHYAHYKDSMYFCTIDERNYAIKPMNCPGAILVYKERPHSYRELPLRLAEFGLVHRFELSGVLHGLFRARAFTIDDGHIFCTTDHIEQEVRSAIMLTHTILSQFLFDDISIRISTKPDNAMGSDELWDTATNALINALKHTQFKFVIQEGEGAFYGPKIEFHIQDSMKRSWQCGTIQLDFFQPESFDLHYISREGTKQRPIMIHRAIYGSLERFLGILLEHYKGKFPFWLAPVQIKVLTITDKQKDYAQQIVTQLKKYDIRTELNNSSDPISGQIKTAQIQHIPWMLICGPKEVNTHTLTLRLLDGTQEHGLTVADVLSKAQNDLSQT